MSSSHFEDSVFTFLKISSNRDSNEMLKMLQKKNLGKNICIYYYDWLTFLYDTILIDIIAVIMK